MKYAVRVLMPLGILGLVLLATTHESLAQKNALAAASHPVVGAWIGSGSQVCQAGVAPAACENGQPAIALMVMPTFTSDGQFFADDTLTLAGPPFGPHSAEHGHWVATGETDFTAVDVFIANPFPPAHGDTALFLARWSGTVIDSDTAIGWFNGYPQPPVPVTWTHLLANEFPPFPPAANGVLNAAAAPQFVKDPTLCTTPGCPLVFKFTLKRLAH